MKRQEIPTIKKYIVDHPASNIDVDVKCLTCSSTNIVEKGLWSEKSRERIFVCSGCNTTLYRSERSEEHTSELQSRPHLVCRLLLEKKKIHKTNTQYYTMV